MSKLRNKSDSLPQRVAASLRREIADGWQAGQKLPGMHALKQRFGVSINTIGAALDILADEAVVVKRRGSGVYVAEPRRPRIGILSELDLMDSRISPYFRAVAAALKLEFQAMGMDPRLYVGSAEPGANEEAPTCPEFWEDAIAGGLDGAAILDVPSNHAWYRRLKQCPIPAVGALTPYCAEPDFPGIMHAAVQRLAEQGCRRLGILAWHQVDMFREAVRECGLETNDAWIRCDIDPAIRGAGWDEFREIWLASSGRPDGLVILDDMLFADAQLAMLELSVPIPSQLRLAVLTCREAALSIRVPAIRFEIGAADIAAQLAAMLQARLAGTSPPADRRRIAFHEVDVSPFHHQQTG